MIVILNGKKTDRQIERPREGKKGERETLLPIKSKQERRGYEQRRKKRFFYIFITRYFNERETVLSILCHRKQQANKIQPIKHIYFS